MRRHVAAAVLALAALVGAAGCGGGGDDGEFAFGGVWTFYFRVVTSNVPSVPPGNQGVERGTLAQDGTSLTVTFAGGAPLAGTCDPEAGTFEVRGTNGTMAVLFTGHKVDADAMAGENILAGGRSEIRMTWTAARGAAP